MLQYLWLLPLGVAIGAYGTLIGAGGGFVLVPLLLLAYPGEPPEIITSISLAVVFCNAFSGSLAYARQGKIDYLSGSLFAAAAVPGAVLGALATPLLPRSEFDLILGIVMIAGSLYLMARRDDPQSPHARPVRGGLQRRIAEADGTIHTYSYDPRIGVGLSAVVGFLSSLLGIGGGIIHVPALTHLMNFPVHVATATSHFVLAIMALAGTIVHILTGAFHRGTRRTIVLSVGVLIGAQIGAALSQRVHGRWILRGLAAALFLVGLRLLLSQTL